MNRPRDWGVATDKVLDSPAKSRRSGDFSEDKGGPKKAEKDPANPEKPDRARSAKKKPRDSWLQGLPSETLRFWGVCFVKNATVDPIVRVGPDEMLAPSLSV